jgi:hypothetical protein
VNGEPVHARTHGSRPEWGRSSGVGTVFDTAPAYGASEQVAGDIASMFAMISSAVVLALAPTSIRASARELAHPHLHSLDLG